MEVIFEDDKTYDFLQSLGDIEVARVNKALVLLEKYGNNLRYPHTKKVERGIFELRILGDKSIRILFCFHNNRAVVLHAFVKKSQQISAKELKRAKLIYSTLR